jgi:acyl carrier protein
MLDQDMPIGQQVCAVVAAELGCPAEQVGPEATLSELAGLDSLKLFRIISTVEYKWSIDLADEEVYQLQSIPELVRLIERETKAGGSRHGVQ